MDLSHYVETFSLLGDESRLRLCALLRERELCVSDLVQVTGISQSRVSTHLGRLREAGIVRDRRQGAQSFYTLSLASLPESAQALLEETTLASDATLEGDRKRLRAPPQRPRHATQPDHAPGGEREHQREPTGEPREVNGRVQHARD